MNTLVMTSPREPIHAELLAGIVHELNNPLTTILGFSELMLEESGSGGERLQKIHAEAQRSVRIVQNMLRLARADSGPSELIDVNESILCTVELVEYQLRQNRIELNLNLSPFAPKVLAHAGELTQVFLNLVTNATQAIASTQSGGKIGISTTNAGDCVRISVSDNGPGIPAAQMSRIFDPFFTTKVNGTGLGLNLSRKIIQEIGGEIRVSSTQLCGAVFTIDLPIAKNRAGDQEESRADDQRTMAAKQSILIVDDEECITDLIDSVLRGSGYETSCMNDGAPAIDIMKKKEYDILICDLHMPGTGGREVLGWVHANRPNIRTILLSGDVSRRETEDLAKSCGAQFLSKPFNISDLRKAVGRFSS